MKSTWSFERALQSRVARRIAGLFILCALIPMAGLAAVTTWRTSSELERGASKRIRYDAKTVMMEALARIELFGKTLQMLGPTVVSDEDPAGVRARAAELFDERPSVLTYIPDEGAPLALATTGDLPGLDESQRARLDGGLPLLVAHDGAIGTPLDLLYMPVRAAAGSGVIVAALDYESVFGLDRADPLPPDSEICVFARGQALVCSPGVEPSLVESAGRVDPDADATLAGAAGDLLVRSRSIPLQVAYGGDPWTLVMMRPQAVVRAPMSNFLWDFSRVLALSALVVSLFTVAQVRRQLRPLVALTQGTRRLANRDFTTPVTITSGDEFEELGSAFNDLSADLQRQFTELEAFSTGTLETLARTIDAKSHWTSGHSERVTDMAVALAIEMGLPEEEVTQLRRGGLVHDIGKIATPVEILDKPAPLNADERLIMRAHAQQGVHILEPIPAFRSLLPIVGQHHERWDGRGYPAGLAGTDIARTARVLAVADVFDAMRSDRPYRRGLPMATTIAAIRRGANTQFDADVVEAFSTLIVRTADQWRRGTGLSGPAPVTRAS